MAVYGKSLRDIVLILDPEPLHQRTAQKAPGKRKERQLKRFKSPHTNEVVETKGGNHRVLKAWKEQYGASTVDSWLQ
ncbi:hypothetical protein D9M68_858940 [compost metagenome]